MNCLNEKFKIFKGYPDEVEEEINSLLDMGYDVSVLAQSYAKATQTIILSASITRTIKEIEPIEDKKSKNQIKLELNQFMMLLKDDMNYSSSVLIRKLKKRFDEIIVKELEPNIFEIELYGYLYKLIIVSKYDNLQGQYIIDDYHIM